MSVRPIVITGEPVLHRRAEPVLQITDETQALIEDMFDTMDRAHGVGLAAPQIGVGLRIFTWQMPNDDDIPTRGVLVNPYVTATRPPAGHPDPDEESEGCLSVPGLSYPLRRGERARVQGQDRHGDDLEFEATGWFARCMQHEYDHLNGFLYVDRLDERWARKARKAVRREGWGAPGRTWTPGLDPDPFGHDDEADLPVAEAGAGHDTHDTHDTHDAPAEAPESPATSTGR